MLSLSSSSSDIDIINEPGCTASVTSPTWVASATVLWGYALGNWMALKAKKCNWCVFAKTTLEDHSTKRNHCILMCVVSYSTRCQLHHSSTWVSPCCVSKRCSFITALINNCLIFRTTCTINCRRCGVATSCWTCDQYVVGSSPTGLSCVTTLGKLFTPTCHTEQYNLVLVEGRWCYSAGKVTGDRRPDGK